LEIKLAGILSLKPEDEKSLHPEALKWFDARRAEIQCKVPLEELNDDDLNTFLSDDENREFIRYNDEIAQGLHGCINKDAVSPDPMTNAIIGLNLVAFQVNSLLPMHRIGLLLKNVHQRKIAKAKQEQSERDEEDRRNREQAEAERRRKEEEEKWQAAQKAVSPPLDDAKRYLDDEGYDKLIQAAREAIEVYLEKGEEYLDDVRTFDYRRFLKKINNRKEEERRKIAAGIAAQEYNQRLNKEKVSLKASLYPNRKDHGSYFEKQIKDHRYTGQSFARFLSSEEEQDFDKTIVDISRKKLDEIVSSDFRQFIDGECCRSYFLLPSAEYSFKGVPCLDFMFDVFAVVETRVWLKPGQKNFGDYIFKLPWREENNCSVLLQEPEFLGYDYLVLAPEDLGGYVFWESIPLVLLKGLLNGETKTSGFTITAAADGMITYKIPQFKEVVNIPDDFAGYLRSIGSIDEMVSMGILTQKIAGIVKSESGKPEVEQKASLSEEKGRDSKKARAFQLFSQGKGPSSPEVKALELHKSTRFKYYNQYRAVHKP
jgi:hypothetical protein